jgi:hypothetical protein
LISNRMGAGSDPEADPCNQHVHTPGQLLRRSLRGDHPINDQLRLATLVINLPDQEHDRIRAHPLAMILEDIREQHRLDRPVQVLNRHARHP